MHYRQPLRNDGVVDWWCLAEDDYRRRSSDSSDVYLLSSRGSKEGVGRG